MYNYWRDRTDSGLCEPLRSIHLNCQLLTKLEMMNILQAQVCGCISCVAQKNKPATMLSTNVQSIDLPINCTA